jgi:nicotinate-nucleotide adenylyltransferase
MKKLKIGVYGGKFDPIHIGHLICAEWTRERFGLDKVLFVTSANPPHKKTGVLDARFRHEMVKAGVEPNCYFEACDIELGRTGPSYTVDTLKELAAKYGDSAELFLMVSAEYLEPNHAWRLDKWHGADEIFKIATILVFPRDVSGLAQIEEWKKNIPQARIEALAAPSPPVSSSLIRERIANGLSVWYMVTAEVWRLIRDRKHYANPDVPAQRISCKRFSWRKPSTWLSALLRKADCYRSPL